MMERCWVEDPEQRPDFRCGGIEVEGVQSRVFVCVLVCSQVA